jgi:hypothetical protein
MGSGRAEESKFMAEIITAQLSSIKTKRKQ